MQDKIAVESHFSHRTKKLATKLNKQLSDLPGLLDMSPRMFHGYRSGEYNTTAKALRKLEAAEERAGLRRDAMENTLMVGEDPPENWAYKAWILLLPEFQDLALFRFPENKVQAQIEFDRLLTLCGMACGRAPDRLMLEEFRNYKRSEPRRPITSERQREKTAS